MPNSVHILSTVAYHSGYVRVIQCHLHIKDIHNKYLKAYIQSWQTLNEKLRHPYRLQIRQVWQVSFIKRIWIMNNNTLWKSHCQGHDDEGDWARSIVDETEWQAETNADSVNDWQAAVICDVLQSLIEKNLYRVCVVLYTSPHLPVCIQPTSCNVTIVSSGPLPTSRQYHDIYLLIQWLRLSDVWYECDIRQPLLPLTGDDL